MKVDKHTATLVTFFLSACVHELVMWCIFKKLRGYLLFLQMCQLPVRNASLCPETRHVTTDSADFLVSARQAEPNPLDEEAGNPGEYHILAGDIHGAERALQSVPDTLGASEDRL